MSKRVRQIGEMVEYCREVGKVPLLTQEQERILAVRLREARSRAGDEHATDMDARDQLIRANLRFVFSLAKRFVGRGLDLPDLVQEGTLGLLRATEDYDPDRSRFTTYASHWIKQHITKAIEEKSRLVRVPTYQRRLALIYERVETELISEVGQADVEQVVREVANMAVRRRMSCSKRRAILCGISSLRASVFSLDDADNVGMLPLSRESASDMEADCNERMRMALNMLTQLPSRDAEVLRLRCGLDCPSLSQKEIGDIWGITRERVRQIEMRALRLLRRLVGQSGTASIKQSTMRNSELI